MSDPGTLLTDLLTQRDELQGQLRTVRDEITEELGGVLDLVVYRRRLAESGLLARWDELQAKIRRLTKQEKSENERRREAGLTYRKRRPSAL